jgi:hypothetical protein
MVSLINASFSYVDFVDLQAAEERKDLRGYKERALDAHRVQLEALTKLRLLAKPKVVELAFELHDIEDQLYSIVYKEALELAEWESVEWEKVKARWHDLQDQGEKVRFERGPRAQNFPLLVVCPSLLFPSVSSGAARPRPGHPPLYRRAGVSSGPPKTAGTARSHSVRRSVVFPVEHNHHPCC